MTLTRSAASAAVDAIGWRYLLGAFHTAIAVNSPAQGAEVVAAVVASCGESDAENLRVDLRPGRVEVVLQPTSGGVGAREAEVAHGITDVVRDLGLDTVPSPVSGRPVQQWEIAIDALDIAAIRPFWKAVLAYDDEFGDAGPTAALSDPQRQGPSVWFQQMDDPRPQRNRIHFDLTVPHELAEQRLAAALAAGGTLVSDAEARAFWILADAEGNEVCICTWQDRD